MKEKLMNTMNVTFERAISTFRVINRLECK